jgi:putative membrane protein
MVQTFLINLLILASAIYLAGKVFLLFKVKDFYTALGAAFFLAVSNAIIRPVLLVLTFPITLLTLGIFILFLNGFMLLMVSKLFKDFEINGCLNATIAYIIISLISWVLNLIIF